MAKQQQVKPKSEVGRTTGPSAAFPNTPAPTQDQIRQRAFEIFMARGGAPGNEMADWLQAEHELYARRTPLRLAPTGS